MAARLAGAVNATVSRPPDGQPRLHLSLQYSCWYCSKKLVHSKARRVAVKAIHRCPLGHTPASPAALSSGMFLRRLACQGTWAAGRGILEAQGLAPCQGFARQQWWQQQLAPPAASAAAGAVPSSLRSHSQLAERRPDSQQEFVYEAPFASAVKRVKVRAAAPAFHAAPTDH